MNTNELLEALTDKASRLGQPAVTHRDLRAWVDRGLVGKAEPKGRRRGESPIWVYNAISVEAANLIVELRVLRVTRTSALRVHLWANGFDFTEGKLRSDLQSEFSRLLRRRHREEYWDTYGKSVDGLTKHQRTALRNQFKKREPRLAAIGPELTETLLLDAMSAMHWPEHLPEHLTAPLPANVRALLAPGLLADPEYTGRAAIELLSLAQQCDFLSARDWLRTHYFMLSWWVSLSEGDAISCDDILKSIVHGDWLIFTAAAMVADQVRGRHQMKGSE